MHTVKKVVNCKLYGEILRWQQEGLIAEAFIENQALPNWILTDRKIAGGDTMAGESTKVDTCISELQKALNQAKKYL